MEPVEVFMYLVLACFMGYILGFIIGRGTNESEA